MYNDGSRRNEDELKYGIARYNACTVVRFFVSVAPSILLGHVSPQTKNERKNHLADKPAKKQISGQNKNYTLSVRFTLPMYTHGWRPYKSRNVRWK